MQLLFGKLRLAQTLPKCKSSSSQRDLQSCGAAITKALCLGYEDSGLGIMFVINFLKNCTVQISLSFC